jgi:hypothetical protein
MFILCKLPVVETKKILHTVTAPCTYNALSKEGKNGKFSGVQLSEKKLRISTMR